MIYTKDHKTLNMFEPFAHLGDKRLKLMEQSWAKLFREEILPDLPVSKIVEHYDSFQGRPTKELHAMLGLMILQEMLDLTDQEAIQQFAFNLQWHYALNITSESDQEAYLCPRTLWSMRSLLTEQGLYTELFETVADKLQRIFQVNTDKQRLDSVHIFSNMRHLSRIGLFVRTIKKFLVNLKRHHKELFDTLDSTISERYLTRQGDAVFAMIKPSESATTLASLSADLLLLVQFFGTREAVVGMHSYQLLQRLLMEQCLVEEDSITNTSKVSVKANKDVPSDSLQNPSDPDASYDGHKGRGYQVQVMETYTHVSEKKDQLNLITYVHVEAAHHSDSHALQATIDDTARRDMAPKELLADSLYGSDEDCQEAQEKGVKVVAPARGKEVKSSMTLANFTFCDKSWVTACPQGHAPLWTKQHKKQRHSAAFHSVLCDACLHPIDCPVKPGKNGHYLRYDDKELRLARRRAYEMTDEFLNLYRMRAGVEATMSEYDRKTGVKHLRVRGLKKVSYCATLKAVGINILRATAYRNRQDKAAKNQKKHSFGSAIPILSFSRIVNEGFLAIRAQLEIVGRNMSGRFSNRLKVAA